MVPTSMVEKKMAVHKAEVTIWTRGDEKGTWVRISVTMSVRMRDRGKTEDKSSRRS